MTLFRSISVIIRLKICYIPEEVTKHYDLATKLKNDGYVYIEIRRGMYGLSQSGLLAQQLLEKLLNAEGYNQNTFVPGLWTHNWRPITFTLFVNDFGVKYVGEQHVDHLMTVLSNHYTISSDWTGSRYLGLDLDWDYEKHKVHLSMLTYVQDVLTRFRHSHSHKPQHQPYPHSQITYGGKAQYATTEDNSQLLAPADKKIIQEITGTFLYYVRAIDATMLPALGLLTT